MIRRASEVYGVNTGSVKPRPGEINIAIKCPTGTVGFDGRLIVEDAQEIRSRRTASDYLRSEKALTVVDRVSILAIRIIESSNPLVAEGLFSACRITTTFRAHKNTAMVVPGDYRVSGGGRSDISEGCIG